MPAQRSVCREGCRRWGVANTSSQGFNHPPYFPVFLKHEGNRLVAEAAFHLSHPVNNRSFAKTKMRKKIQLSFSVTQSIQRFLDFVSHCEPRVSTFSHCYMLYLLLTTAITATGVAKRVSTIELYLMYLLPQSEPVVLYIQKASCVTSDGGRVRSIFKPLL